MSVIVRSAAAMGIALSVCVITNAHGVPAAQAAALDPDFQIKFKLTDAAVAADGTPSEEYLSHFDVVSAPESESLAYFDTASKSYSQLGWSIRLRLKENADSYDLTYKYRHPLADNSLSKASIDSAIVEAKDKNFDSADTNYDAQVNTSFDAATLDFSTKKSVDCTEFSCVFPSEDIARSLVAEREPGKLQKASGTTLEDAQPTMTRVVEQRTWRTKIAGITTDVEISKIGNSYWAEISEEEGSRKDTIDKRTRLKSALDDAHLLAHDNAFKTGRVLAQN